MKKIVIIFLLGWLAIIAISGCNSSWTWPGQKPKPTQITVPSSPSEALWHIVKKSNWLVTLAIPIIALGAVAMFNGAGKLGMSAIIFGCVNLFMALATARFALWMGVFGLIGSGLAVIASILVKNKALKEIIRGTQALKDYISDDYIEPEEATNILERAGQTRSTRKFVQDIKTNLKLKGEI